MKKVLSLLLALCLLVGTVPMLASAADDDFTIEDGVLVKYNGEGENVVIPNGVTSIGEKAFENCESILSVKIPEGVTSIGSAAFFGCNNLENVSFPSSLKIIGGGSFRMTALTNVNIPDGVTTIGGSAFSLSSTLVSVTIPNSVTSIGAYAFEMLANLSSITLPEGLTTISKGMFYASEGLRSITIPASVTKIEDYVFLSGYDSNFSLKDIYYGGTEEQWKKIDISSEGNNGMREATIHFAKKPSTPTVGGFTDVKADAYYADAVVWAVENGITSGIGGGKFAPAQTCKREQIVTFLYRSKGSPDVTVTSQFTDMPKSQEFQKAISWAVENGITMGNGKGKFLPEKGCTRAEAMTFIWRAAGKPEPKTTAAFEDMPSNSDFRKAISWAVENDITSGIGNNKFGPNQTCKREHIVTLLYKAKDL